MKSLTPRHKRGVIIIDMKKNIILALLLTFFAFPISTFASGELTTVNDGNSLYLSTSATNSSKTNETIRLIFWDVTLPNGFFTSFNQLFNSLLSVAIAVSVLLTFFYLIYGGFDWITSGGDKAKTDKARQKIQAAVIGLILVAASYAILTITLRFIGVDSVEDAINKPLTNVGIVETAPQANDGNPNN